MLIPKVIAALLVVRQLDSTLPTSYCTPECPSCNSEYLSFNSSTACVANSTFITDCSICQQCILTYNINLGQTPSSEQLENDMVNILNLCENSTVSGKIRSLQSDASRISAALVASTTMSPTTSASASPSITPPPTTTTHSRNYTDWTTMCSTETWCSNWSSRRSASSAAAASSLSAALANATAAAKLPSPPAIVHPSPLNLSWIVGPIVGCILGFATVFTVIYCTRRKQAISQSPPSTPSDHKEFNDSSSTHSTPAMEKAQLHSECVEPKELESTELVELPAVEPVGNELLSPKSGMKADGDDGEADWPLPISPLPALFAASEIRDQRLGVDEREGLRHETFYHP